MEVVAVDIVILLSKLQWGTTPRSFSTRIILQYVCHIAHQRSILTFFELFYACHLAEHSSFGGACPCKRMWLLHFRCVKNGAYHTDQAGMEPSQCHPSCLSSAGQYYIKKLSQYSCFVQPVTISGHFFIIWKCRTSTIFVFCPFSCEKNLV